jgi:phosphate transport system substrate-binding protein
MNYSKGDIIMGEVNQRNLKKLVIIIAALLSVVAISGCVEENGTTLPKLTQTGSSTVLPLAIAWAEEFDGATISVSGGGSSHGINFLLSGQADLGDASRLMKSSDYEKVGCNGNLVNDDGTASAACNGVLPTKWVIAYDMLAVVINPDNDWATQLNYTQLYEIFTDDNPAIFWDEISGLNETAPHEEIEIYAPDEASGTYDYFFEEIIPNWGKDDQQANTRLEMEDSIYHPSADDNVILNAIRDNEYAIGFFGFAYYKENPTAVSPVKIADGDDNYQEASLDNVANYPMARPLHIYTDGVPESDHVINDYLQYVLSEDGQDVVPLVGYVRLSLVDEDLITDQLALL